MAKVFEADARGSNSTINKVTGEVLSANNSPTITKTSKGLAYTFNAANCSYSYTAQTLGADHSIVFSIRLNYNPDALVKYLLYYDASNYIAIISNTTSFILRYRNTVTGNVTCIPFRPGTWYNVIITKTGTTITVYVNGELAGTATVAAGGISLGSFGSFVGNMFNVVHYSHALTEQERSLAYKDFLNSYPQSKDKYACGCVKPMDLSREKENTVGANVIPLPLDFTSGWNAIGTGSIISSTTFTTTIAGVGGISKSSIVTVGKRYKAKIKGTTTSTSLYVRPSGSATYYSSIFTGGAFEEEFTFTATTDTDIYIRSVAGNFTTTITQLEVHELTGLVAAYNFVPNGNTLVDISGNGRNGTIVKATTSKKGLTFKIDGYVLTNYSLTSFISTDYTISARYKKRTTTSQATILYNRNSVQVGGVGFYVGNGTVNIVYNGLAVYTITDSIVNNVEWSTVTASVLNKTATIYYNGVSLGTLSLGDITHNAALTAIGNYYADGGTAIGILSPAEMEDVRIYNRALSANECKAYHNLFVTPSLTEDFSTEGADGVAKVPSGWNHSSGSFKVGEWQSKIYTPATGWTSYGAEPFETLTTSGTTIISGINTTGLGIAYLTKTLSVEAGKRYRVKHNFTLNSGTAPIVRLTSNTTLNTTLGLNSAANASSVFEFTCTTSANPAYLGYRNESGVASNFSSSGLEIEEIPPLPTFKLGTKYLECITAGRIAIPSKQAYGTWEFDWYKGGGSNMLAVFFSSSKPNNNIDTPFYPGYGFYFNNGEQFLLGKFNTGASFNSLLATGNTYGLDNTWYRIRVTRSLSGSFTCLAKGASLVPTAGYDGWTLLPISGTGSGGTNPVTNTTYTTSEYFVLDIDAGDRIANIQLTGGIKQY